MSSVLVTTIYKRIIKHRLSYYQGKDNATHEESQQFMRDLNKSLTEQLSRLSLAVINLDKNQLDSLRPSFHVQLGQLARDIIIRHIVGGHHIGDAFSAMAHTTEPIYSMIMVNYCTYQLVVNAVEDSCDTDVLFANLRSLATHLQVDIKEAVLSAIPE